MKQRVITALWGVPLVTLLVWLGGWWFFLLVLIVAFLGGIEFYRMTAQSGGQPLSTMGLLGILLFLLSARLVHFFFITPLLLTMAVVFPLIGVLLRHNKEKSFTAWAWTLGGILYVGWMLSHYVALREVYSGREWVLLTLFSTFACDIFAFFVGKAWGKHHLAPAISPGKTWEGALAGFLAALGATWGLSYALNLPLGSAQIIVLGSLIGIFAQLGDLSESLLKRSTGVKDSGSLLPGHGGILDRIDSLIFSGVVVYYYATWTTW